MTMIRKVGVSEAKLIVARGGDTPFNLLLEYIGGNVDNKGGLSAKFWHLHYRVRGNGEPFASVSYGAIAGLHSKEEVASSGVYSRKKGTITRYDVDPKIGMSKAIGKIRKGYHTSTHNNLTRTQVYNLVTTEDISSALKSVTLRYITDDKLAEAWEKFRWFTIDLTDRLNLIEKWDSFEWLKGTVDDLYAKERELRLLDKFSLVLDKEGGLWVLASGPDFSGKTKRKKYYGRTNCNI